MRFNQYELSTLQYTLALCLTKARHLNKPELIPFQEALYDKLLGLDEGDPSKQVEQPNQI